MDTAEDRRRSSGPIASPGHAGGPGRLGDQEHRGAGVAAAPWPAPGRGRPFRARWRSRMAARLRAHEFQGPVTELGGLEGLDGHADRLLDRERAHLGRGASRATTEDDRRCLDHRARRRADRSWPGRRAGVPSATAAMSVSRPNRSTTLGPEAPVSTAAIAPTTTNEPAKVIVDGPDSSPAAGVEHVVGERREGVGAAVRDGHDARRHRARADVLGDLHHLGALARLAHRDHQRCAVPSIAVRKCRSSAESSITAAMPPRASSATAG